MPYEDYYTYTEYDLYNHITIISANTISFMAYRNSDDYVYKDKGWLGYFYNFEHQIAVRFGGFSQANPIAHVWTLTWNTVNDWGDCQDGDLTVKFYRHNKFGFTLQFRAKTIFFDWSTIAQHTWYYLTIERTGNLNFTCKIYTDSARTILYDTLTGEIEQERSWRYIYACQTHNTGGGQGSAMIWADIADLELFGPIHKPLPESLELTDSYDRTVDYKKDYSENLGLVDTRSILFTRDTFEENLGIVDSRFSTPGKNLPESLDLTDDRTVIYRKNLLEDLGLTDVRSMIFLRDFFEELNLVDIRSMTFMRSALEEFLGLVDSRSVMFEKNLLEDLEIIDVFIRTVEYFRKYGETLIMLDAVALWSKKPLKRFYLSLADYQIEIGLWR